MWSYTAVIKAYAQAGNLDGAERTLETMLDSGCEITNAVPFNEVLKICSKQGNVRRAELVLERMDHYRVKLDKVSYLMLMKTSAQSADTPATGRWLEQMEKTKL